MYPTRCTNATQSASENLCTYDFRVIWRKGTVSDQWRQAEGVWIPKEENSTKALGLRPISLLSVEGKILLNVISTKTDFPLKNTYIDTSE